jgi:DNA anti-recombination protein RmuC
MQVMQGHTKSPIALKQFVLCEAHNNELKHYCVDCSKPLCFECLASQCRSHNTHELTAVASQNKQSLRSATQELQAQHEAINERLKQIHERISGKQPQQLELAPPIATTVNHNLNHKSQSQPNSHINQQKPCHPRRKHARLL